ncbi:MAG TPA: hypothetical protein VF950_18870 [Planctomycetota bacterium]
MLILLLALLQDASKDDVLRLTKEGKPEAEILKAIGPAKFKLSADEVVELKKAGVAEAVLSRMILGPSDIAVENKAHKAVRIRVLNGVVEIGVGEELRPGTSIRLPGAGEFAVTVDGRPRSVKVKTPATLTFRGCDVEKFEVVTLYVEGPSGSDTCVVESRMKETGQQPPPPPPAGPPPGARRIMRGGLLDRTIDFVGGLPGGVADVLFGW